MSDSAAPRVAVRGRRTVTLRDGSRVTLREIAPSDKPLLAASFERLSPESRYRRFFTAKTRLSEAELDYLVNIDHNDHEAVVAIDPVTGDVVGVARYIRSGEEHALAEVAVTVADHWQGRGLGRALIGRLDLSRPSGGREALQRFRSARQPGVARPGRRCRWAGATSPRRRDRAGGRSAASPRDRSAVGARASGGCRGESRAGAHTDRLGRRWGWREPAAALGARRPPGCHDGGPRAADRSLVKG